MRNYPFHFRAEEGNMMTEISYSQGNWAKVEKPRGRDIMYILLF
jgi:hypothetical protein